MQDEGLTDVKWIQRIGVCEVAVFENHRRGKTSK